MQSGRAAGAREAGRGAGAPAAAPYFYSSQTSCSIGATNKAAAGPVCAHSAAMASGLLHGIMAKLPWAKQSMEYEEDAFDDDVDANIFKNIWKRHRLLRPRCRWSVGMLSAPCLPPSVLWKQPRRHAPVIGAPI